MMAAPLITVICLCHNQGRFIADAIRSIKDQTYPNIELIVVDDASADNSVEVIRNCLKDVPASKFFPLTRNVGNCKAFNHALSYATGAFVLDLAADDILLPDRLAEGVKALDSAGDAYGVNFSDAFLIDESGRELYLHSRRFPHNTIPQGDIYRDLIERYFVLSPTMMFRATVIRELGGYDERLRYEDFDFMIRSSRNYLYAYTPKPLVKKRIVKGSMSQKQLSLFSPQLWSTFAVCEKILALNRNASEQAALARRILYEMRVSIRLLHFPVFFKYVGLWYRNRRIKYS